ncbi:MAG TPA: DUF4105 domain-containing protein [Elusimicrobiales bacterium]|nr:DUF4105 domain-containing protein [Elusimicrobiales bacterium]
MFLILLLAFSFNLKAQELSIDVYNSEFLKTNSDFSSKKYGVSYSLKGVIKINENKPYFYTSDGRIFILDMKLEEAKKYQNKSVEIYAKALQSDKIDVLKPSDIKEYDPSVIINLPDYQNKRKPSRILSRYGDVYEMENIRWEPKAFDEKNYEWRNFKVDVSKLKDVYFVKKPFTPEFIAAHSMLLFKFDKGGVVNDMGEETDSFVLSIEAYLREGQSYSLVDGMRDKFNIIWIFATWKDYSYRTMLYDMDSRSLILYSVKLSLSQKKELLEYALAQASVNREGEYYNTITNNCTNNLVILINKTLPENKRIKLWEIPYLVYNVRATMPNLVVDYLQGKEILGSEFKKITPENYTEPLP